MPKRVCDVNAEIVMFFNMKKIFWDFQRNGEWRMGLWFCLCCRHYAKAESETQNYKVKVYLLMNFTCKWKPFKPNFKFLPGSLKSKLLLIFLCWKQEPSHKKYQANTVNTVNTEFMALKEEFIRKFTIFKTFEDHFNFLS